jgi:hypothetical protein
LGQYHDILAKQGPEAAAKFVGIAQSFKGGAGASNAVLADKAYDNVMKRLDKDYTLQAAISKDPAALQRAVDEETRRLQRGGAGVGGGAVPENRPSLSSFDKP